MAIPFSILRNILNSKAAYRAAGFDSLKQTAIAQLGEKDHDAVVLRFIEGRSFKDLAAETGVSINTLLSRKHYAVLHLRERLREIHQDFI